MPIQIENYDTIEDLYKDVELLIWSLCHKFTAKYGGDVEEHFANASTLFMRAFKAYDPDKGGAFSTILHAHVWGGLLDMVRLAGQRNTRLPRIDFEDFELLHDRRHFDLLEFKRTLSRDGAVVVSMVVHLQRELERKLAGAPTTKKKQRQRVSRAKQLLTQEMLEWGWTRKRIRNAFSEVADAVGAMG